MRTYWSHLEKARVPYSASKALGSNSGDRAGVFVFKRRGCEVVFVVHDGLWGGDPTGWEHVSFTLKYRGQLVVPTWEWMCWAKELFWGPEEAVMQIHPPSSDYVNTHPTCLHLWRQVGKNPPLPDAKMV